MRISRFPVFVTGNDDEVGLTDDAAGQRSEQDSDIPLITDDIVTVIVIRLEGRVETVGGHEMGPFHKTCYL